MFVAGSNLGLTPEQLWFDYNSQGASDLCGGIPGQEASNYGYLCNSSLDYWSSNSEFVSTPGEAIADLQVAMDIFGNHTFGSPVFGHGSVQAYLKGWTGVNDSPTYGKYGGAPAGNYWSLLNMWNPSPTSPGPIIRWGQRDYTTYLNPFLVGTGFGEDAFVDSNLISEIYDPLLQINPYNPSQLFGWMANSYSMVTNLQDPNCPSSVTRNFASFPVAGCLKLMLR